MKGEAAPGWQYQRFVITMRGTGDGLLLAAIFFAAYITWRPVPDILFTASDTLFLTALLFRLAGGALNAQPMQSLTIPWLFGLFLLLSGLLLGSVVNDTPMRWMIVSLQYATAYAVLPLVCIDSDREIMHRRCIALVLGVVAMEGFGAFVYFYTGGSRDATMSLAHEFITGAHRLGAFMADANWNAALIAMTVPFVLYLGRLGRMSPPLVTIFLAVLITGLLLSGSFTGFTATLAATATFWVLAGGKRNWRPIAALALLGIAIFLIGAPVPAVFQARVGGALESGDIAQAGTFVGRWELMKEAWLIVDSHPLIGLGVDRYREVSESKAPVHNLYLLLWAEGGLPALLGWLMMIMVPIAAALHRWRDDRAAAALVMAVALPFIAFSMASPHMYARNWAVPLILATGVALAQRRPEGVTPNRLLPAKRKVSEWPARA